MKYLEIKDNKGYYWNDTEMVEIDQINKEDLLKLISHAEEDDFQIDVYDETKIQNKAHQIIFQSIHNKISSFLTDKNQFKREVEKLYVDAVGEYGADIKTEKYEENILESDTKDEVNIDLEDIPF